MEGIPGEHSAKPTIEDVDGKGLTPDELKINLMRGNIRSLGVSDGLSFAVEGDDELMARRLRKIEAKTLKAVRNLNDQRPAPSLRMVKPPEEEN